MKRLHLALIMMMLLLVTACSNKEEAEKEAAVSMDRDKNQIISEYRETVKNSKYIIHALGGMDGEASYINSIDCLKKTYEAGYRLFEADISFTSDDVLVLAHSGENNVWSENDWKLRLGQTYPFEGISEDGMSPEEESFLKEKGYDIKKHLCSYDTFMSFKIQGKYKATSFRELLDFMEQHTDMYVMVDAGHRSYEDTLKYYRSIVSEASGREQLLDRLIAGGQTTEMVKAAREAYDFPLINLYYDNDEKREEEIYKPEDFINYCLENDITSFSSAKEVYTEEVAAKLENKDIISYIFTVNNKSEAEALRGYGADIIGTDHLWEELEGDK